MRNSDVLFVGWGGPEGVSHYRTILPARELDAEWVIFDMEGKPMCGEGSQKSHRVVIVQNCWYDWQLKVIRNIKASGAIVLFNVDDWIKSIARMETAHGSAKVFQDRDLQAAHRKIFGVVDGVIASTDWIAEKIRRTGLHDNIAIARNGIDAKRYTPWMNIERDMGVIIGWAGGTGHADALRGISAAVSEVVSSNEDVHLWIVGQDETALFNCEAHHVQWEDMHFYPRTLACFDINLAPATESDFYKGKSQLRLYEAMTMGTPSVVHPMYDEVGKAGVIARTHSEWLVALLALVQDEKLRKRHSHYALQQAKTVTIQARIGEWEKAIEQLTLEELNHA